MNTFFSNIAGSLNTPEYVTNNPISDNISDPIIKLIVKYRKYPCILTIGEVCNERKKKHAAFSFLKVAKEEIFREILNLDVSKACKTLIFLPKSLRRTQTSLPDFYILVLISLSLTLNFHQF